MKMLDLKYILNNKNYIIKKLSTRNYDISNIEKIVKLIEKRNQLIFKLEKLLAKKNELSQEIGIQKRNKKNPEKLINEVNLLKEEIDQIELKADKSINKVNELVLQIPNIPYDDVPIGHSDLDNVVIKEHATLGRGLVKNVEPHYDIATKLDIIDFSRAVKLAQTRFVLYKKEGAALIRALENFMLDTHIKNGYEEIMPPHIVNSKMLYGTGQLPKFKEDLFKLEGNDL